LRARPNGPATSASDGTAKAREALRAMGELAIPVLEQRAATGDLQAVDDLAFIGTPVAAESLARLTCMDKQDAAGHSTITVSAAWRLAELLAVPDVVEGLKNSGFQVPAGVPSYDWVWKPFAFPGTQDGPIGWIIGRVALIIDSNPLSSRQRRVTSTSGSRSHWSASWPAAG
jgi:hypothetical protein